MIVRERAFIRLLGFMPRVTSLTLLLDFELDFSFIIPALIRSRRMFVHLCLPYDVGDAQMIQIAKGQRWALQSLTGFIGYFHNIWEIN